MCDFVQLVQFEVKYDFGKLVQHEALIFGQLVQFDASTFVELW